MDDLGVQVSTGPVVDFRLKKHLAEMPEAGAVPLLYPGHFKINEAKQILISPGLPRMQQNERSALCLLALLNLRPRKRWSKAENPLGGFLDLTTLLDGLWVFYGNRFKEN